MGLTGKKTHENIEEMSQDDIQVVIPKKKTRFYFVDYARFWLCVGVMVGHVFRFYDDHGDDTKIAYRHMGGIESFLVIGHLMAMSGFFLYAGCSSVWSIKSNTKVAPYILKRTMRLLIPLFGGLVLFVIPTKFLQRSYLNCGSTAPDNIFAYFPYYFTDCFSQMGFYWLWFLPLLFAVSILFTPLIKTLIRTLKNDDRLSIAVVKLTGLSLFYVAFSILWVWFFGITYWVVLSMIFNLLALLSTIIAKKLPALSILLVVVFVFVSRTVFHMADPPNDSLQQQAYVFMGYLVLYVLGAGIALVNLIAKGIFNSGLVKMLTVTIVILLFFCCAPTWDGVESYRLLGGIYSTFNEIWNRQRWGYFSIVLVMIFSYNMAALFPNEVNPLLYSFCVRSFLPGYIIHPFVAMIFARIFIWLDISPYISLILMSIFVLFFSLFLATLIDMVPYVRGALGYSGKPWFKIAREIVSKSKNSSSAIVEDDVESTEMTKMSLESDDLRNV
ncbi:hypothetical protein PCE1_003708 [Barthelona sp. PCE]